VLTGLKKSLLSHTGFQRPEDPINFAPVRCSVPRQHARKRILIYLRGRIGDMIMFSPILRSLRTAWPDCWIDWLSEQTHLDPLTANPYLDGYLGWIPKQANNAHRFSFLPGWSAEFATIKSLVVDGEYDIFINFHGTQMQWLAELTNASRRIAFFDVFPGYDRKGSESPERFSYTDNFFDCEQEVPRTAEYSLPLRALGLPDCGPLTQAGYTEADEDVATSALREMGIEPSKKYVVISPLTTRITKNWSLHNFAAAASAVSRQLGARVVIIGGPEDHAPTSEMQKWMDILAVNCCGQLTFRQSLAVIAGAELVLTGDTAAMHAAAAVNTPVVSVFGSTSALALTPPLGLIISLSNDIPCAPCNLPQCPRGGDGFEECLKLTTPNKVVTAAIQLLRMQRGTND
jgi:ADP-heptose:LPS heptosyltransferase